MCNSLHLSSCGISFAVYWLAGAELCFIISSAFFFAPLLLLSRLEEHKED